MSSSPKATSLTATELRANLYRVLDAVLATGRPCRVVRGGRTLVIEPEKTKRARRDWSKLRKRPDVLNCTFDELVATTWEYRGDPNL
jgi:hypothetical protein